MVSTPIYAIVARGRQVILAQNSPYAGNYPPLTLQILKDRNMKIKYQQQGTKHHRFYSLLQDEYIFMVLVEKKYNVQLAFMFLKQIQEEFFIKYDEETRSQAIAFRMKEFDKIIGQTIMDYNEENSQLIKGERELSPQEKSDVMNLNEFLQRKQEIFTTQAKSRYYQNLGEEIKGQRQSEGTAEESGCNCRCLIF